MNMKTKGGLLRAIGLVLYIIDPAARKFEESPSATATAADVGQAKVTGPFAASWIP